MPMIEQIAQIFGTRAVDRSDSQRLDDQTVNESPQVQQLHAGPISRTAQSQDETQFEQVPLEYDHIFDILKNRRRRDVLRYLIESDGAVDLGDLAEWIAALENDKTVREISSQERKRVYVSLYQCHLPKMDDTNAVSYNKPRGTITAGENLSVLTAFLPDERQ